jgi:putative pyruvate formate lyase activating enzyme
MDWLELYENCKLCPRQCGVNRSDKGESAKNGFCGESDQLRVAYIGPHFGEEPALTGKNGSGTVFFSGCTLRCSYCQNYQISLRGLGTPIDLQALLEKLLEMVNTKRTSNINFVTPDQFIPHVLNLVPLLRENGVDLPIVFNLSGYQSIKTLKMVEEHVDIYLPDFKYSDSVLAKTLSRCGDYSKLALNAIADMVKQKGFLDVGCSRKEIARKGVLVRHLILPGFVENSIGALTSLFLEFGEKLPISIMSQYYPVHDQINMDLNRVVSSGEFGRVYAHALELGFSQLYVQFPDEARKKDIPKSPFLPDFLKKNPFSKPSNIHSQTRRGEC